MRLDHLLSREKVENECVLLFSYQGASAQISVLETEEMLAFPEGDRDRKMHKRD